MFSRSALSRGARLAAHQQACLSKLAVARGYAAASCAFPSFAYDTSEAAGIKIASRDSHGPTTKLAVVAKAGTRYEPAPGLTVGLEEFAFKNTHRRSALRIIRETELLGGRLTAYHTREALVVEASFLREDLPYFAELLAEVISQTRYTTAEFHEDVERVLRLKQAKLDHDVSTLAIESAHSVAFHTGLGAPLYPTGSTRITGYLDENNVARFAESAYAKSNIALVGDGVTTDVLSEWTDKFFKTIPETEGGPSSLNTKATKYYGGEQRTALIHGNSIVIALPGSSLGSFKPEIAVLAAFLGGRSNVKWTPGFTALSKIAASTKGVTASAVNLAYSDAGLVIIQISGPASSVRSAAHEAVKVLKSIAEGGISKEDLTKAIAKARFDALASSEAGVSTLLSAGSGILHTGKPFQIAETTKSLAGVTADKVKAAAKTLIDGKTSVAAVGDLNVLPYAEELGLKV